MNNPPQSHIMSREQPSNNPQVGAEFPNPYQPANDLFINQINAESNQINPLPPQDEAQPTVLSSEFRNQDISINV